MSIIWYVGMYFLLFLLVDGGLALGLPLWAYYMTRDEDSIDAMLDVLYNGLWITEVKEWISNISNHMNEFWLVVILSILLWPANVMWILIHLPKMVQIVLNWKKTGS